MSTPNETFARTFTLLVVIAACLSCGGEHATVSTTSQALGPTPYEVVPGVNTALDYADKCGLVNDYDLRRWARQRHRFAARSHRQLSAR